jgi:predicted ATPase
LLKIIFFVTLHVLHETYSRNFIVINMLTTVKQRCFVITGGPGMGKTTLINALQEAGYPAIPESGRSIIKQQVATGGTALPWLNAIAFANAMWKADFQRYMDHNNAAITFFDRGFPDVIGYLRLCRLPAPGFMLTTARAIRYNPKVFITPPWEAIYRADEERKQPFAEAVETYHQMKSLYRELDYETIEIPLATVEERVAFVQAQLTDYREK